MPEIGRVYRLNEPDYRYGVGPLAVRVTRVIREAGQVLWSGVLRLGVILR
jgi:hypothetical protein